MSLDIQSYVLFLGSYVIYVVTGLEPVDIFNAV